MRVLGSTVITAGLSGLLTLTPRPADACGGTFCDAGPGSMDPQAMPIDQTGETIVFVIDETHIEAHIQIEYDPGTNAERFAWLIPVFGEPEFSVGSQQLFLNLQNSTVPSYGYTNFFETCGGGDEGNWDEWDGDGCDGGGAAGSGGGDPGGDEGGDDGATTGGGTEVLSSETIGAFDIVTLQSQTADDLMIWLGDNEYFQDPAATPILQEYIDEGASFVAVRLTNGADVGEIHPIVLRYEGDEPCVPIRLTQIAARDDMDVRAFFLSAGRVYPSNYRHVELNPLKFDWIDLASNYKEVVTMAIDEPLVDGHGFVTEFAGPSAIVPRDQIFSESWAHSPFADLDAVDVADLLRDQGLLDCSGLQCTGHPLILGILRNYLPVPQGLADTDYYNCMECYEEIADLDGWDGVAFAIDMRERIIGPAAHAMEILDDNAFLTRMYTTLSPHEMNLDPMFHATDDTGDAVDLTAVNATRNFPCSGRNEMQLPGTTNRDVRLMIFDEWPEIAPEAMPWAQRITEHLPGVAPVVLLDNQDVIDELLAAWNSGMQTSQSTICDGGPDGGPDDEGGYQGGVLAGCRCRTEQGNAPASWMFLLLGVLGLRRMSRRRAKS